MGLGGYAPLWKVGVVVAFKLGAFIDESEDDKAFCMTALLARIGDWAPFEAAWEELLRHYVMSEFHMQDCEHGQGHFEGWTNPAERAGVAARFRGLIADNILPAPMGVVVGIDLAAYARAAAPYADKRGRLPRGKKPWLFAFNRQLGLLATAQEVFNVGSGLERVGLLFDAKSEFEGRIGEMMKAAKSTPEFPVGTVAFADSRTQPALQMADLVAWEMRRLMTDIFHNEAEPRSEAMELVRSHSFSGTPRFHAERWRAEDLTTEALQKTFERDPGGNLP
jgi:uncharacterized protein DUF3800